MSESDFNSGMPKVEASQDEHSRIVSDVTSSSVKESNTSKILRLGREAAAATWSFSKSAAIDLNEKRKRAVAAHNARIAEQRRQSQIEAFRTTYEKLKKNRDVLNPSSWEKIEQYEAAVGGDPAALHAFAESSLIKDLVGYSDARAQFRALDTSRALPAFLYEVSANDLFSAVGYGQINPVLKSIASKYKISNVGNTMAGAILVGRKNYGGAALAMADTARVGAHNGAADTAFTNHLKYLVFAKSGADMVDVQRRYLRYAYRLLFMNEGDKAVVIRAIFSLTYSNNNCSPRPPSPPNKFSSNLHPEFHNNFRHLIWTIQEAIGHLETERQKGGIRASLFSNDDISAALRNYTDAVPDPGFHLTA